MSLKRFRVSCCFAADTCVFVLLQTAKHFGFPPKSVEYNINSCKVTKWEHSRLPAAGVCEWADRWVGLLKVKINDSEIRFEELFGWGTKWDLKEILFPSFFPRYFLRWLAGCVFFFCAHRGADTVVDTARLSEWLTAPTRPLQVMYKLNIIQLLSLGWGGNQTFQHAVAVVNYKGDILFSSMSPAFADRFYCADMPPPSDIVKVAIEWPGANAQLIEMDQVRAAFTGTAHTPPCNQCWCHLANNPFCSLFAETRFVFNNPGSMWRVSFISSFLMPQILNQLNK